LPWLSPSWAIRGSKPLLSQYPEPAEPGLVLENAYLRLLVFDSGLITLEEIDGDDLLYPEDTSDITLRIDGADYGRCGNPDGWLPNYIISGPSRVSADTAQVVYEVRDVRLTIEYKLIEDTLRVTATIENYGSISHLVGLRFMLDTQVGINDGSPLYAPTVGVCTYETQIADVTFNVWKGYDFWPDATITTYCTMIILPDMIIFAHWPTAINYEWEYYGFDPSRRFYTPGYTTSPESDSCVLMYYNPTLLEPGEERRIVFYYGVSQAEAEEEWKDLLLGKLNEVFNEIMYSLYMNTWLLANISMVMVELREFSWMDVVDCIDLLMSFASPTTEILEKAGRIASDLPQFIKLFHTQVSYIVEELEPISKVLSYGEIMGLVTKFIECTIYKHPSTVDEAYQMLSEEFNLREIEDRLTSKYNEFTRYLQEEVPAAKPEGLDVDAVIEVLDLVASSLRACSRGDRAYTLLPHSLNVIRLGSLLSLDGLVSHYLSSYKIGKTASTVLKTVKIGLKAALPNVMACPKAAAILASILCIVSVADTVVAFINLGIYSSIYANVIEAATCWSVETAALEALLDDVISYVKDEIRNPRTGDYDGYIEHVSVPIIFYVSIGSGEITIVNTGARADVKLLLTLYAETPEGLKLADTWYRPVGLVDSLESMNVDVPFSGFDYGLWGGAFIARIELWMGPRLVDVETCRYYVNLGGASEVIEDIGEVVIEGIIDVGEKLWTTITSGINAIGSYIMCIFGGSDVDLHVYDSTGRHVGVNYTTGEVEVEIPGASYSGPDSNPEWVMLPGEGNEYLIEVVGVEMVKPEEVVVWAVDVEAKPAILSVIPASVYGSYMVVPGEELEITLTIRECSYQEGLSDVIVSPSNLEGPLVLEPTGTLEPFYLPAGKSVSIAVRYAVPSNAISGNYMGTIIVMAEGGSQSIEVNVTISLEVLPPEEEQERPTLEEPLTWINDKLIEILGNIPFVKDVIALLEAFIPDYGALIFTVTCIIVVIIVIALWRRRKEKIPSWMIELDQRFKRGVIATSQ